MRLLGLITQGINNGHSLSNLNIGPMHLMVFWGKKIKLYFLLTQITSKLINRPTPSYNIILALLQG